LARKCHTLFCLIPIAIDKICFFRKVVNCAKISLHLEAPSLNVHGLMFEAGNKWLKGNKGAKVSRSSSVSLRFIVKETNTK